MKWPWEGGRWGRVDTTPPGEDIGRRLWVILHLTANRRCIQFSLGKSSTDSSTLISWSAQKPKAQWCASLDSTKYAVYNNTVCNKGPYYSYKTDCQPLIMLLPSYAAKQARQDHKHGSSCVAVISLPLLFFFLSNECVLFLFLYPLPYLLRLQNTRYHSFTSPCFLFCRLLTMRKPSWVIEYNLTRDHLRVGKGNSSISFFKQLRLFSRLS